MASPSVPSEALCEVEAGAECPLTPHTPTELPLGMNCVKCGGSRDLRRSCAEWHAFYDITPPSSEIPRMCSSGTGIRTGPWHAHSMRSWLLSWLWATNSRPRRRVELRVRVMNRTGTHDRRWPYWAPRIQNMPERRRRPGSAASSGAGASSACTHARGVRAPRAGHERTGGRLIEAHSNRAPPVHI